MTLPNRRLLRWAALLYGVLQVVAAGQVRVRYDHHHVYKLEPKSEQQLAALQRLDGERDSYIFLDAVHEGNAAIKVVVAPQRLPDFLDILKEHSIAHELLEEDAQRRLEEGGDEVADEKRRSEDYTWDSYHTLDDTYAWLHRLPDQYPQASVFKAGSSYEGREILGLRVSNGSGKKAVFLEAGIHAREWIGPATATYIIHQLLNSSDPDVRWLAGGFDWYIVPHSNPDGYVYTHTTDRLWRKTRTPYGGRCFGVDPNRNWGFHWNEVGASNNPCSDTYAGPKAFSEIETKSLAASIASLKERLFLYLSLHSYSQLLLFPYGHTSKLPANYDDLKRVFDAAVAAIARRYGTRYRGGNIYDAIYPAAGASVDWAYGAQNVSYSFCYELRPSSMSFWTGFKLPASQIIPTGAETLDSIVAMVREADKK